jgi:hypothetical protein
LNGFTPPAFEGTMETEASMEPQEGPILEIRPGGDDR